jgi:A118 family predicted phage portal protein
MSELKRGQIVDSKYISSLANVTKRHGYNPIIGDIQLKQQEWLSWFRGSVNEFHTFTQKINGITESFERQTMNMPKKLCEDMATLLWNEKCHIIIEDEPTSTLVNQILEDNNFDENMAAIIETSFGMGMGYIVEYLDNGETKLDFINFENALPLAWNNRRVTALATFSQQAIEKKYYTHIQYHEIKNGKYTVTHEAYISGDSQNVGKRTSLDYVLGKGTGLDYSFTFDSATPGFQVIKPNIQNQHNINSPYGVSVYSTMISYFKIADTLFDMFQSEAEDNRTRIIVDSQLLETKMVDNEETGEVQFVNYFNRKDTCLMALPIRRKNGDDGQKAIEYFQGDFRMDMLEIGLNKILQTIGFRAGLGKNFYLFNEQGQYQNEKNVIHSSAETYKTKKKHEKILGRAIKDMIRSILVLEKTVGRYNGDPNKIVIKVEFDDSIVQDDEAIALNWTNLADKGYIPPYYAVAKTLKIPLEEAIKMYEEEIARKKAIIQAYEPVEGMENDAETT